MLDIGMKQGRPLKGSIPCFRESDTRESVQKPDTRRLSENIRLLQQSAMPKTPEMEKSNVLQTQSSPSSTAKART